MLSELFLDHENIGSYYQNRGILTNVQGDYDKSIELEQKALELKLKRLNPDDPRIGGVFCNISSIYCNKGDYQKALEACNKVLIIYKPTLGDDNLKIGGCYQNEATFRHLFLDYWFCIHTNRRKYSKYNRTRLVVTIFEEPFMMLKKNRNKTVNETSISRGDILDPSLVEGYCADLAYIICHDKLKLPYKFLIETKYGSEIEKGVWNGIIGTLINREADLSIAPLTITGAREKVVDFSKSFIDFGISIIIRKPKQQKCRTFLSMLPRPIEIGIFAIISYIVVRIFSFFISRSSSYLCRFESKIDGGRQDKLSIQDALFLSLSVFMHQNVDLLPRSLSGRMAARAWLCFSLIIVLLCAINFIVFLTYEKSVRPIETIEDLAKQTEIRYGTIRNSSTMTFFNKSTFTTFKHMWNFMEQHKDDVFVASNREGIEKVRRSKGTFAFLTESTFIDYANKRVPCDTMRIGENLNTKDFGIATPLGSDLREAIHTVVLELKENGFLERLKQKWYYERSECTTIGAEYSKPTTQFNLVNVVSIFYIVIMVLGIAMVITILEFLLKAKIRSNRLN
ncbi:unnamed protein product [Rotaria sp. Silwood2]|nr:unnamed protein product [Rotaria sp. Silwood2]CAF4224015.1 unnamed protein product [Rotaria sp. Silwood2]